MAATIRKAKVKATGKVITVYKCNDRGTWLDAVDCLTEYQTSELTFGN